MSSKEYYDKFISYQIESGINDRIFGLYKRLKKLGLPSDSNILEIGCGIGSLTYLLSGKIKKGYIEAMDLSPESIAYAKLHIRKPNINFSSSDIIGFEPGKMSYNKILLFDVLEHVPENNHQMLFDKISSWMNDDTQLLINLPNPEYLIYDQLNQPHILQETDQPIFIDSLALALSKASLMIDYIETYSVWFKNDYQFIIVKKRKEFKEIKISDERNLFAKGVMRMRRSFRKLKYRYPVKQK